MNALSLHQPWASAMALGLKSIETRSWRPPEKYVGERFVIASTKHQPGTNEYERSWDLWRDLAVARGAESQQPVPLGCIVASGVLTDAVPIEGPMLPGSPDDGKRYVVPNGPGPRREVQPPERAWGDFSPGRWAWLFSDLARVEDRCPWCWGEGDVPDPSLAPSEVEFTCPVCDGEGSCAPVPVRGKQRVWQWEPAPVLASWSGEG